MMQDATPMTTSQSPHACKMECVCNKPNSLADDVKGSKSTGLNIYEERRRKSSHGVRVAQDVSIVIQAETATIVCFHDKLL